MNYTIDDFVICFDVVNKNKLNFHLAISLLVHAIRKMCDANNAELYKKIHNEFLSELIQQNVSTWPEFVVVNNTFHDRKEIITVKNKIFNTSNNVLTLLTRIVYLEKYKNTDILSMTLDDIDYNVCEMSMYEIVNLVKDYIEKYLTTYTDSSKIENKIGKNILQQLV